MAKDKVVDLMAALQESLDRAMKELVVECIECGKRNMFRVCHECFDKQGLDG